MKAPLNWPLSQRRTLMRGGAAFKVSMAQARQELVSELFLLKATEIHITSDWPVTNQGNPVASAREPVDPGVSVYFDRMVGGTKKPFVIACDSYRKVVWNLRAIGMTVEALRTIARHGASAMLEQAFTGFLALPAASDPTRPWWEVLGIPATATFDLARDTYLTLSQTEHPDRGGTHERMVAINRAFEQAKVALR